MDLISPYYKHLLNRLHHQRPRGFGNTAWLKGLEQFTDGHKSFLDYGCGKGNVVNGLKERYPDALVRGYDPGMPDFDKVPDSSETYEFLLCTDVLEHIEPDRIDNVLQHINFLFTKKAYLMIDTVPARKFLPDGRNAHLILEQPEWWDIKIKENIKAKPIYTLFRKKKKYIVVLEKDND